LKHVLARRGEVLLVPHDPRPKPALEDVAAAPVPFVEELRVAAVEAVHAGGELGRGRLDDEVVVGAHQAVGLDAPVELARADRQQVEEVDPVDVVAEDRRVLDPVRRDVEVPVREAASEEARHLSPTVARAAGRVRLRAPFVPQSSQFWARPWSRRDLTGA
jgi:hypothetical protein